MVLIPGNFTPGSLILGGVFAGCRCGSTESRSSSVYWLTYTPGMMKNHLPRLKCTSIQMKWVDVGLRYSRLVKTYIHETWLEHVAVSRQPSSVLHAVARILPPTTTSGHYHTRQLPRVD